MVQLSLPTIREVQQAPERTVLSVLEVCATNAEQILLSRNPDTIDFRGLERGEPPAHSAALIVASRQLVRTIYDLRDAISLYEAALRASLCPEQNDCDDDLSIF